MPDEPPTAHDRSAAAGPASPLERLIEVQDHDTAIDQLRHRREFLPERVELRTIESHLSALDNKAKEIGTERDELGSRQAGLEQQIEASKTRRSEIQRKMFAGQVTAPRELQAMDDEVRHLGRHISELEDREIEIMEALEPLDNQLSAMDAERVTLDAEATGLREKVTVAESAIDVDLAVQQTERDAAATGVPQDLIARYEQLRKKLGGTGAARLAGNSCSGCHLALPSMEVDRIRRAAADAVITCDQCGRILVR